MTNDKNMQWSIIVLDPNEPLLVNSIHNVISLDFDLLSCREGKAFKYVGLI